MPEDLTMQFHGLLGAKFDTWIFEQRVAPQTTYGDRCVAARHVDDTRRLSFLFGERFTVSIKKTRRDKYFRILAQVIADEKDVGQSLIAKGLAVS